MLKAAQGVPTGELVFFRSFFGFLTVVVFLALRGELSAGVRTQSIVGHATRGIVGTVSMMLFFFALSRLPLPEAVTLGYAMPLLIVVFSAVFLREVVRLYRWTAVAAGFAGVVIIAWPSLTLFSSGVSSAAAIGVAASLGAATLGAVAQLLVGRMVETERPATVVFYFLATASALSLLTVPFGWVTPTPLQAGYLVGAGIAGGIAQILLAESYRHAEMSVVAPFEYSSLVLSVLVGFVFFGDVPTLFMLVGGLIVVASGIFIIYRERRLGIDVAKAKARAATTL